jgi:MFS transporter, FSR family, fosmidomycin resistance protein
MALVTRSRVTLVGVPLALLITASHLSNDAFANVLPAFLPTLQGRFGLGEAALAGLVALISLSANVLQAFAGAFTDRWGRRRAAALGLLVSAVVMSFIAVAPSVPALVLMLALGGVGSAVFHPAAVSMMRDVGGRTTLYVGLFAAGGAVGTAIMPVVALAVLRTYGASYVPLLALVGVALAATLVAFAPAQTRSRAEFRPKAFDMTLFRGPVGALALAGILRATAFVSFANAMPLYLVNVRGFAAAAPEIGTTLATYSFAAAAAGLLAGAFEQRIGRVRLVVLTMVAAVPVLVATLLVAPATATFYVLVALSGMLTNASVPLLVVSAQDLAPHAVGSASGMLMGFTWGMAGVAYLGFGALQELVGITPALMGSFVALLPAAALAGVVLRRNRARLS